jgi:Flp pilus assembly protein CpaB
VQSKTPLLMVTALVCGLGAAFGTWKLVQGSQAAPAEDVKVKVLVPIADIAPYSLFQDEKKFASIEWPKSKLREAPEDTITSFDQIKGKTSRHWRLRPNEPFYKPDVCERAENDIESRLRPGEVAQSIRATADSVVGGFVNVGDRVDILAMEQPTATGESASALYILEDIEVLAVDANSERNAAAAAGPSAMNRIVLRLSRDQSLQLKLYHDTCKLDVVRRKLGDKESAIGKRYSRDKRPVAQAIPEDHEIKVTPVEVPKAEVVVPEVKTEVKEEPTKLVDKHVKEDHTMILDPGTGPKKVTFKDAREKVIQVPEEKAKENGDKPNPDKKEDTKKEEKKKETGE